MGTLEITKVLNATVRVEDGHLAVTVALNEEKSITSIYDGVLTGDGATKATFNSYSEGTLSVNFVSGEDMELSLSEIKAFVLKIRSEISAMDIRF